MKNTMMKAMLTLIECVSIAVSILHRLACILERYFMIQDCAGEETLYNKAPQGRQWPTSTIIVNCLTGAFFKAYQSSLALKGYFGRPSFEAEVHQHEALVAAQEDNGRESVAPAQVQRLACTEPPSKSISRWRGWQSGSVTSDMEERIDRGKLTWTE